MSEQDAEIIRRETAETNRALTDQYRRSEHFMQNLERNKQAASLLLESGMLPDGWDTPQQVFVGMSKGAELGLAPVTALTVLYVVHGEPAMSAQGLIALAKARAGAWFEYEELEDPVGMEVTIHRPRGDGETETYSTSFTMEDAERIDYYDGDKDEWKKLADKFNYRNHPLTMCKWRAVSDACRTVCADVVLGIGHTPEELDPNIRTSPEAGGAPSGTRVVRGEDPYRGPRRSTDEEMEEKAAEQGERVAKDLGADEETVTCQECEQDVPEGEKHDCPAFPDQPPIAPVTEPTAEQKAGTEPAPPEEAPKGSDEGTQSETEPSEEDAGAEDTAESGSETSEKQYPTLAEFAEDQNWGTEKLEKRIMWADEVEPLPDDYAAVQYAPGWWYPIVGGNVIVGANLRKLPVVMWCRRHKASQMYDVEAPDEDWSPEEEKLEEFKRKLKGEDDEDEPEEDEPEESGGDEEDDRRALEEMSPDQILEEFKATVERIPDWDPGFVIRLATDHFMDRVKDGDIPTVKGYADPTEMDPADLRDLAARFRQVARRKVETGEDPDLSVKVS